MPEQGAGILENLSLLGLNNQGRDPTTNETHHSRKRPELNSANNDRVTRVVGMARGSSPRLSSRAESRAVG